MTNAQFRPPKAVNEPVSSYAPGTARRAELQAEVAKLRANTLEIPLIIGGNEVRTGALADAVVPHDHAHVLARWHKGSAEQVRQAIEASQKVAREWAAMPWEHRASIFLRAADLLAGPWRATLNAATMLGQSKTAHQAEIDSACELIDFFRFNVEYMVELYGEQPISSEGCWNRVEQRPLEGYVFAVTPFNFTSIAGNLPTAPALMGNTVVWKPASTAVYSGYFIMKLLEEAGLPPGVVNFVPGSGGAIGRPAIEHELLAGVHFTGSTEVFRDMWKQIGGNIERYKSYPRIVGETGGKDFVFAHASADVEELVTGLVRGAFEFQGQKCSAASRAYVPRSLWNAVRERLVAEVRSIPMGPTEDFGNFMGAVIDRSSFEKCRDYVEHARAAEDAEVLVGGECDDREGFFVAPTVITTTNPRYRSMVEEIFGPILTIQVYDDAKLADAVHDCDTASDYALTGAIFARDRFAIANLTRALVNTAGNFYINDKPTGAVVGQQPFGGSRASGTNDKAGSKLNLTRWVSTRTIKENFLPPRAYRYPFMQADDSRS